MLEQKRLNDASSVFTMETRSLAKKKNKVFDMFRCKTQTQTHTHAENTLTQQREKFSHLLNYRSRVTHPHRLT